MDTYSKWVAAKLYTTKTPITGANLLNDRILPFFSSQEMGIIRILTDRDTEYCGKVERHDYELYLGVNGIEHTSNGMGMLSLWLKKDYFLSWCHD